jgi:glycosyltransferase involved in cell wall biosynthesis
MAPKRVAVIGTRGYPSFYGGFETAVRKIVESDECEDLDFVVFSRKPDCKEDPKKRNVRVIYTRFLNSSKFSTLSHIFFSINKIKAEKPDVILAFNVACGFVLPIFRLWRIPVVLNVDGLEWKRGKWGFAGKAVFFTGAWLSSKLATELIADSTNIANYWEEKFGRKCNFIPYGGTPDKSREDTVGRRPYVLFVARFVPENHICEFLEATPFIDPSVDIYIVGKSNGSEYGARLLSEYSSNDSRIKDLGRVTSERELNLIWKKSLVYFHGHSVGGTNPALVQAMANACSIVAFDSEFNREVLEETAVFSTANPNHIALCLNSLIKDDDLRRRLSDSAYTRAIENYSWSGVCQAYRSIIFDLV